MKMKKTLLSLLGMLILNRNISALDLNMNADKQMDYSMIFQNSYLIYEDIYLQTKPAIMSGGFYEANPIARAFFDRNLWNIAFFSSVGGMLLGNYLLNKIDKMGALSDLLNVGITIAEAIAINNNNQNEGVKKIIPLKVNLLNIYY